MVDRTSHFSVLTEQISKRNSSETRSLIHEKPEKAARNEFTVLSSQVGKGIKETTEKLANLTKLARNRDLFMDKTVEIQELTFVIKQDIHNIKKQITILQDDISHQRNPQAKEHSEAVVKSLNSKLKGTVNEFKEALELRTENLKVLQETKKMFTGNSRRLESPFLRSPLYADSPTGGLGSNEQDVVINMGQSAALMQLERVPNNVALERLNTVETIHQTIIELGEIFQQMGQIVAEQDFLIQRIDYNVTQVADNTAAAEKQLQKYWSKISNNWRLITKVFLILIAFIIVFVVFVA
jgi:syntaxin 5